MDRAFEGLDELQGVRIDVRDLTEWRQNLRSIVKAYERDLRVRPCSKKAMEKDSEVQDEIQNGGMIQRLDKGEDMILLIACLRLWGPKAMGVIIAVR